jgi:hypothetical protein
MYFAGPKILEVFQIGVIQGNVAVQIGALSYAGQLNSDIVADANLVPDLTVFANGMTEDLERLGARSMSANSAGAADAAILPDPSPKNHARCDHIADH